MTIGFYGAGKMAEAIVAGLLSGKRAEPGAIWMSDRLQAPLERMRERYQVNVTGDVKEVANRADTLVLAVKPQDLTELLASVATGVTSRHCVISIAAGSSLAWLAARLPDGLRLVRVMPNLALQVGEGMSVYCLGPHTLPGDEALVTRIFGSAGDVMPLPEDRFDAVTALSGSGPAFIAYFLNAMIAGGESEGLSYEVSRRLATQTLLGTARVLTRHAVSPDDFIRAVASPKGTTAEGLAVLRGSDLNAVVRDTLHAAARRGRELQQA